MVHKYSQNTLLMFLELLSISVFVGERIFPQNYFETEVYVFSSQQNKLTGQTQTYVHNMRDLFAILSC